MPPYEYRVVMNGIIVESGIYEESRARNLAHLYDADVQRRELGTQTWRDI